jgi:hypothetical protein
MHTNAEYLNLSCIINFENIQSQMPRTTSFATWSVRRAVRLCRSPCSLKQCAVILLLQVSWTRMPKALPHSYFNHLSDSSSHSRAILHTTGCFMHSTAKMTCVKFPNHKVAYGFWKKLGLFNRYISISYTKHSQARIFYTFKDEYLFVIYTFSHCGIYSDHI